MAEDVEQAVAAAHQQERDEVRPPRADHGGRDDDAERLHERHHDRDRVAERRDAAQLVAQRAHRHGPGVQPVGRQHVGQQVVGRDHRGARQRQRPCRRSYIIAIATINLCNILGSWRRCGRSTPGRSCCRSCSGSIHPCCPARALVAAGRAVRHRPRHDAHRAVADGRRRRAVGDGDGYRLVGRLLERKEAQDIGRRPAPRGVGRLVDRRRRHRAAPRVAARRAFRTHMANLRMGELRPGHVDAPGQPGPARRRRRAGRRARAARRRRPGRRWPAGCGRCRRSPRPPRTLDAPARRDAARRSTTAAPTRLPPTITLAAEVVRFLRAEPLLPPALTPQPWPPDALRDRYREFDRALGRTLRHAVRG